MFRLKPNVLSLFLLRRFFISFFLVMLTVCGVIFAVTFVERLSANPDAISTLYDTWVRLLEYIPMFLPLAVFMGTLVAFYNLTKSSELIIISGTGRSPFQIARPFLVGAFLIGVFATTVINPYSVNLSNQHLTGYQLKLVDNAIWLRDVSKDGFMTVRATGFQINQNKDVVLNDVKILTQDNNFKLQAHITAQYAVLHNGGIHIENGQFTNAAGETKIKSQDIVTKLTPETVLDRYLQPDQISFWNLPGFIKKMDSVGVPTHGHLMQFWTLLFLPLNMLAMVMLGIAFSQTKQRRNYSFGIKFSLGILTCFALYFIVNLFNALGNTGALPPLIAIIAPQIIIIAGACTFITSFDTI